MNLRLPAAAMLALPALVAAGPAPTPKPLPSTTMQAAVERDLPSIVLVVQDISGALLDNRDGTVHGPYEGAYVGTGFFVSSDGYLVTAGHVAAPTDDEIKDELVTFYIDQTYHCDISTSTDHCQSVEDAHHEEFMNATSVQAKHVDLRVLTQEMKPDADGIPATLVASSPSSQHDTAVLKVDGSNEPVSLLADSDPVPVNSSVAVIGYPVSGQTNGPTLVPTLTEGSVNARRHGDPLGMYGTTSELFQIDAHTEHGNSGGPGVQADGGVIGIVSFGDTISRNYLISSNDVRGVLDETPAKNQLGQIDNLYRAGLDAYTKADFSTAKKDFDQCAALNPAQIYCEDMSADAASGGPTSATGTTSSGTGAWTVALFALFGVIVLVLLGAVALRRRPAPVPAGAAGAGWYGGQGYGYPAGLGPGGYGGYGGSPPYGVAGYRAPGYGPPPYGTYGAPGYGAAPAPYGSPTTYPMPYGAPVPYAQPNPYGAMGAAGTPVMQPNPQAGYAALSGPVTTPAAGPPQPPAREIYRVASPPAPAAPSTPTAPPAGSWAMPAPPLQTPPAPRPAAQAVRLTSPAPAYPHGDGRPQPPPAPAP